MRRSAIAMTVLVLPAATTTFLGAHEALGNVDRLLRDDSNFRTAIDETLTDAQRALGSVRALADYIDHHPESLLRGRAADRSTLHSRDAAKRGPP